MVSSVGVSHVTVQFLLHSVFLLNSLLLTHAVVKPIQGQSIDVEIVQPEYTYFNNLKVTKSCYYSWSFSFVMSSAFMLLSFSFTAASPLLSVVCDKTALTSSGTSFV